MSQKHNNYAVDLKIRRIGIMFIIFGKMSKNL